MARERFACPRRVLHSCLKTKPSFTLQVKELVETVLPFTAISFHRYTAQGASAAQGTPTGIEPLHSAAARLMYEIQMESQATGLDVRVEVGDASKLLPP